LVALTSPVSQPFKVRHSCCNSPPSARWIAPSTPPPRTNEFCAALTTASTFNFRPICFFASLRGASAVEKMGKVFGNNSQYQNGIRLLLKHPTTQAVRDQHLKISRHHAVFHFDPAMFGKRMRQENIGQCTFVSSTGDPRGGLGKAGDPCQTWAFVSRRCLICR
jgi:hypothetical protein